MTRYSPRQAVNIARHFQKWRPDSLKSASKKLLKWKRMLFLSIQNKQRSLVWIFSKVCKQIQHSNGTEHLFWAGNKLLTDSWKITTQHANKHFFQFWLTEWFAQQATFATPIDDMSIEELNKCLSKFYVSARKKDGSYYKKSSLLSIRAAIDRYLKSPPHNKNFSICDQRLFNEANSTLNAYLKHLTNTGSIAATVHKNPLTSEVVKKLFDEGELGPADTEDPRVLLQTAWFYVTLYLGKRGRENQSSLNASMLRLVQSGDNEFFELDKAQPGTVLPSKNHTGGLQGTEDHSDGKIFPKPNSDKCPVKTLKAYLSHLKKWFGIKCVNLAITHLKTCCEKWQRGLGLLPISRTTRWGPPQLLSSPQTTWKQEISKQWPVTRATAASRATAKNQACVSSSTCPRRLLISSTEATVMMHPPAKPWKFQKTSISLRNSSFLNQDHFHWVEMKKISSCQMV